MWIAKRRRALSVARSERGHRAFDDVLPGCVEKIGYHDVTVGWLESYNYVLRILQFFELAVVQEVLYFRRRARRPTNE